MQRSTSSPSGVRSEGFDAVVLAGGAAQRLGGIDKPALRVGGTTLLQRVLAGLGAAQRVVVVGPHRAGLPAEVKVTREDPPGSGPVAALAAGVRRTAAGTVLVLGADLPWVASAVGALREAVRDRPAAALCTAGRVNYVAAAWRRPALVAALARLGDPTDLPLRRLYASVAVGLVDDPHGWGRDCDDPVQLALARAELG